MKLEGILLVAALAFVPPALTQNQSNPDFSGRWVRGDETMVIVQTSETVKVTTINCCRPELPQSTATFYFNKWGPRLARNPDDDKPTQVRWDGNKLILHQGPEYTESGGGGGFVQVWSLHEDELVVDTINRGLGLSFDFRESSIPWFYVKEHKTYKRDHAVPVP
jgi:hypothetical protein